MKKACKEIELYNNNFCLDKSEKIRTYICSAFSGLKKLFLIEKPDF